MESKLAKALYDNTAECADELGFRKGDIVTVTDQNVADTSGWWMCSLYGRQGLAPANRLQLLPRSLAPAGPAALAHGAERAKPADCQGADRPQNIYQIPSVPRPSASPAYECMDRIYKVPSNPLLQHGTGGPEGPHKAAGSSRGEVYDVPNQRRASLFTTSTTPRQAVRKASLIPISELERRVEAPARCSTPSDTYVYAVPPPLCQEPSYDIPVPSDAQQKSGYLTLPNPRKPEWIYDVPVSPEKPSPPGGGDYDMLSTPSGLCRQIYDTMPSSAPAICRQIYDTMPSKAPAVCRQIYDTMPSKAPAVCRQIYDTMPSKAPAVCRQIYDTMPSKAPAVCRQIYDTMPSKAPAVCRQIYDTLPARAWPAPSRSPPHRLYDIPKPGPSPLQPRDIPSPPKVLPRVPLYGRPPLTQSRSEDLVYAVPPQEHPPLARGLSGSHRDYIPLECRGESGSSLDHARVRLQRSRKVLSPSPFRERPGSGDSLLQEDEERAVPGAQDSQRISTASSSSTSSCDSLALSSSSPEPLREVTLGQEEAGRRLLELQGAVCRAVPRLMEFVSSRWRSREHLGQHLVEVREAAEATACSLTYFLNFALDIKGNARRLSDGNLQARLYKQLCIVEDSGVILQQTVGALGAAGWPLSTLAQDPGQAQTPDQLDRFVMVARTVPEDVKRLVSILNANGKLLFRPQTEAPRGQPEKNVPPEGNEGEGDLLEDDNDYVQLQAKHDYEKQQKVQREPKENIKPLPRRPQVDLKRLSSGSQGGRSSVSEHCRLYFGALQKAILGFVGSLRDGQPPERFISHSKLVIMVGQRLVDTLCREAQGGGAGGQGLLCKSNLLCALLKQLAVATKKAALHFPDRQALQEAQDFAKELAQRAQHFRISLDL